MVWIVVAICMGLYASEIKRRRFWIWFSLSMIGGPIAWYYLVVKTKMAIPAHLRMACPHCAKVMRSDMKRCPNCKKWVDNESKDRAEEVGRTAATFVFSAKRMMGNARHVAERAANSRTRRSTGPTTTKSSE